MRSLSCLTVLQRVQALLKLLIYKARRSLLQTVFVPLPDVGKRSTLPEDALRAVVDAVGVVGWARCAAFLSKELGGRCPRTS